MRLGEGAPVFVIAEAGVNHNGDSALAKKLIDAAAAAGADAIKFQTFTPEELVSEAAPQAAYQTANTGKEESQISMLRDLVLPYGDHQALKSYAEGKGLVFLSTPFSIPDADFLETLGMAAYKIPSGELTNIPFLAHIARKGKPIILSTGMATLEEVREALDTLAGNGATEIALFHCTTEYPTPPADINLRAMQKLAQEFGLPTGLSDHSEGISVPVAAVALGAQLIEKHFTLDRTLPGPDHKASLEPDELKKMIGDIRIIERALGSSEKKPVAGELETARVVRKSVVARRDILIGTRITAEDIYIVRPGTGIPPKHFDEILGKTARETISQATPLEWNMLS
ncbi:MAG: N-acetylneuraminate synthase [Candidatus Paceibacterota bacterium]